MEINVVVPPEFFRSVVKVLMRTHTFQSRAPLVRRLETRHPTEIFRVAAGDFERDGQLDLFGRIVRPVIVVLYEDRIVVQHPDSDFEAQLTEELREIVEVFGLDSPLPSP
jgi:hypothetical protein